MNKSFFYDSACHVVVFLRGKSQWFSYQGAPTFLALLYSRVMFLKPRQYFMVNHYLSCPFDLAPHISKVMSLERRSLEAR